MAVLVRRAFKSYRNGEPVIQNLNLTVKVGTIYGLLGASGCGKTTVLSCILGLRNLDSGSISVFGYNPCEEGSRIPSNCIGYMAQETALHQIFTIRETFFFFGRIYGMDKKKICERIEFINEFLQLPDLSMMIMNLSGGQLRRVSLGVALIHEPKLLILDEPTVGLDPLIRENIWNHFLDLTNNNRKTTILLTTHYTQESKFCGTVGIMRKGCLVAEENPQTLLSQNNSTCLELTVLELCRKSEKNIPVISQTGFKTINEDNEPFGKLNESFRPQKRLFTKRDITIIYSLIYKSFLIQKRHYLMILVQILLPLSQLVLCHFIVGGDLQGLKLGFVSNEWNSLEEKSSIYEYCQGLKGNKTCLGIGMPSICEFLNQFENSSLDWVTNENEKVALQSAQDGELNGYLYLPNNFTRDLQNRFLLRQYAEKEAIDGSIIFVKLDMTNAITTLWLIKQMIEKYFAFIVSVVKNCGIDPRIVQLPLKFNAIYGDLEDDSWIQYFQPGAIILLLFALANISGGIYVIEKREGVIDRWTVAGVNFGHYFISSLIWGSFTLIGQIITLFTILPWFYGLTIKGSWILAIFLVYFNAIAGIACGFFVGVLVNHEIDAALLLLMINVANATSCGAIWPLEAIHPWYRILCKILPPSFTIESLRSIMYRGWGLTHFSVLMGFVSTWVYTILTFAICLWLQNKKR